MNGGRSGPDFAADEMKDGRRYHHDHETAGSMSAQTPRPHADRLLVHARIWTAYPARPQAEALAIAGDKIVAVGPTAEVKTLAATDTEVLDLGGRLVIPGLQDSSPRFREFFGAAGPSRTNLEKMAPQAGTP